MKEEEEEWGEEKRRRMLASQSFIKATNRASTTLDAHGETRRFIYRGGELRLLL